MTPRQKHRLKIIIFIILGTSVASFFALKAYNSSIEYFISPAELAQANIQANTVYRTAGLVKKGSHTRLADGVSHRFKITDCENDITIQYTGILPDLFREGQAIVAKGAIDSDNILQAQQVLAKHDENYIPKEAAQAAMKAQANKCETVKGKVEI